VLLLSPAAQPRSLPSDAKRQGRAARAGCAAGRRRPARARGVAGRGASPA
jgi:hypothetical protein